MTAYEKVTLHGLTLVERRPVHYGPIDPRASRQIFIESALVNWDYDTEAPYFRHNRQLVREMEMLEAKARRRDILVDAKTRFAFYDARIPAGIHNGYLFERWRRQAERNNRRLLFMTPQDLMRRSAEEISETQFPAMLVMDGMKLPLQYRFDPGNAADGVTVTIRLAALGQLSPQRLEWVVPGLLEEKVLDLIRTLPKSTRVNLVPAPGFAPPNRRGDRVRRRSAAGSSGDTTREAQWCPRARRGFPAGVA